MLISKKVKFVITAVFLIVLSDVIILRLGADKYAYVAEEGGSLRELLHPLAASYLSGGYKNLLLPFVILLMGSDNYIRERRTGLSRIIIVRIGRRRYFRDKYKISFLIPFSMFFLALIINLLLAMVLFKNGSYLPHCEQWKNPSGFFRFEVQHPYMTYILFIVTASLAAGFCGVICRSVSFIIKNQALTYVISMLIWVALSVSNFSVNFMYEPFSSYDVFFMIMAGAILVMISGAVGIIGYMKALRTDE